MRRGRAPKASPPLDGMRGTCCPHADILRDFVSADTTKGLSERLRRPFGASPFGNLRAQVLKVCGIHFTPWLSLWKSCSKGTERVHLARVLSASAGTRTAARAAGAAAALLLPKQAASEEEQHCRQNHKHDDSCHRFHPFFGISWDSAPSPRQRAFLSPFGNLRVRLFSAFYFILYMGMFPSSVWRKGTHPIRLEITCRCTQLPCRCSPYTDGRAGRSARRGRRPPPQCRDRKSYRR